MRRLSLVSLSFVSLSLIFALPLMGLLGCGGSGGSSTPTVALSASPITMDQGQTSIITATTAHDAGDGVSWSLSGAGTLSGSSTVSVTYTAPATVSSATTVTITATSLKTSSITASIMLTVEPGPAITTTAGALAAGQVGAAYSVTLAASGGITPYAWSLVTGTLPTGLSLNATTGAITGTPTLAGSSSFTVRLSDTATPPLTTTANFSIVIGPAPAITFTTTSLASATIGTAYSASVVATGGAGTLTYSMGTGTLPAGLTLASTGSITGTPTAVGSSTFTIKATDSYSDTATSGSLSIVVNYTALNITTSNLPPASVDTFYTQTFVATGGSGNYSWAIISGLTALQNIGMSFNTTTGVLSGAPYPPANSYSFTVQVTDTTTSKTYNAPYTFLVVNGTTPSCSHNGSANSILNGNYAILLSGFDPNGNKYESIGDFKADGAGNITAGSGDVNSSGFATAGEQQYAFTGTYSIGDSAADNRGIATLTNTNTTATGLPATAVYCFTADAITAGVAYSGRIIEADGSGFVLTGYFQIQNPADFTNAAITGGYAYGVQGANPGTPALQRAASIGQITFNGAGGITSGQLDAANYSSSSMTTTYTPAIALISSGSSYSIASNGRGTLTLNTSLGSATFVVYVVATGSKFFMLSTGNINSAKLLAGQAIQQTMSNFTTANVKASGAYRAAGTTNPSQTPVLDDVQVGQITFDGAGNLSGIGDENKGGAITGPNSYSTTYSVTSSGYVSLPQGSSTPPYFYLYAPGSGFGLDASQGVHFFYLAAQTVPLGGYTTASMAGNYAAGTITPLAYSSSTPYPSLFDAYVNFGTTSLTLIGDGVVAPGLPYDVQVGSSLTYTYVLDPTFGGTSGRFVFSANGVETEVGYIVSTSQVFLITASSGTDGITIEGDHQ